VLIVNTSDEMLHMEIRFDGTPRENETIFYYLLSVQEDSVGVLHMPEKLSVSIYREVDNSRFELEVVAKGHYFVKAFQPSHYIFFLEGFEAAHDKHCLFFQISRRPKVKLGRWLESSPNGYENFAQLYMPMYHELGFSIDPKSPFALEPRRVNSQHKHSLHKMMSPSRPSRQKQAIESRIQALSSIKH
jgi:hypothetical protein